MPLPASYQRSFLAAASVVRMSSPAVSPLAAASRLSLSALEHSLQVHRTGVPVSALLPRLSHRLDVAGATTPASASALALLTAAADADPSLLESTVEHAPGPTPVSSILRELSAFSHGALRSAGKVTSEAPEEVITSLAGGLSGA